MTRTIRIATRKSPLALWQANDVLARLEKLYPDLNFELVTMTTKGDKILDTPLAKVGGKGLFVKELEVAIIEERADLAVHSMKDVPMEFPQGLKLSTICEREDPLDAFVSNQFSNIDELPQGATVGTSSLRRQSQLKAHRSDLQLKDLRGNVGTRLGKLDAGEYDAIILASAGLKRLGLENRITSRLLDTQMLPAVGQGAVGIEIREEDHELEALLKPLHCQTTASRVNAERAMNTMLNGGCQVPIAGYAIVEGESVWLRGMVAGVDGKVVIRKEQKGLVEDAEKIGEQVGKMLLDSGAKEILEAVYEA